MCGFRICECAEKINVQMWGFLMGERSFYRNIRTSAYPRIRTSNKKPSRMLQDGFIYFVKNSANYLPAIASFTLSLGTICSLNE